MWCIIEAVGIKSQITESLSKISSELGGELEIDLTRPDLEKGDYTTNLALVLASKLGQSPQALASKISEKLKESLGEGYKVEIAGPGFVNIWLSKEEIFNIFQDPQPLKGVALQGRRMVEYAHPNTHKEMHIGHLRTLITGEALARLFEANGATVFRANYQGDIGPHVAKALFGAEKMIKDLGLTIDDIGKRNLIERAKFLGEAYALGNKEYEGNKSQIDEINDKLYKKDPSVMPIYEITRKWSLEYYEEFYKRFYTKFDRLFFESEMVEPGKRIVKENVGKVFKEDNGAVIFPGEQYGLHTRVFLTQAGNPTYEGKEMGNGFAEQEAFPFDEKIHIVGSEQAGYFQVVFKALELIDPDKFEGKQRHISMGMVTFTDRKMSSRTGDILRVDWLIDQVKERVKSLAREGKISAEDVDSVIEMVAIGAIKYSVLKVGTGANTAFDIEKSVSLEGDSGPYLQYTYARTRSVLAKSQIDLSSGSGDLKWEIEESDLLRHIYRFSDVVEDTGREYSPNILAEYLFHLAKLYNNFYQKHKIIGSDKEAFRLVLTKATGKTLKDGLNLLGIKSPERM